MERKNQISKALLLWFKNNSRNFLWRQGTPYEILVAEMLLHKTRAVTVEKYFPAFLQKYPNIQAIAFASIIELSEFLNPLGLYNRKAMWMKNISNIILNDFSGKIPETYKDLISLPGIGPYIANAVMCFAYDKPVSVLDVNVSRVIGRLEGVKYTGDLRRNKKLIEVANSLVPLRNYKEYNWALIDLGALVCSEKNPKHKKCPISYLCKFVKNKPRAIKLSSPKGK